MRSGAYLLMDRSIRLEYLLKSKFLGCAEFDSLDRISERLDKDWDATEEGVSFVWSSRSVTPRLSRRHPGFAEYQPCPLAALSCSVHGPATTSLWWRSPRCCSPVARRSRRHPDICQDEGIPSLTRG
jgi:hypothetical protein